MKTSLSYIKEKIEYFYNSKIGIVLDLNLKKERTHLTDVPSVITGVYPNVFTATLFIDGKEKKYSFQYSDLLTGNINIKTK